jgi:hypothetical protein
VAKTNPVVNATGFFVHDARRQFTAAGETFPTATVQSLKMAFERAFGDGNV